MILAAVRKSTSPATPKAELKYKSENRGKPPSSADKRLGSDLQDYLSCRPLPATAGQTRRPYCGLCGRNREVVSRDEWLAARKDLLTKEKEATRARDALNAERRKLPMVEVDKDYTFEGPTGKVSLSDLFDGQRQLAVYHFMFDPDWEEGCSSCSMFADGFGRLEHLRSRDTNFVVISRAPVAKLEAFKARMSWDFPWYSSFGTSFNYDFRVTQDETVGPVEYNYRDKAELEKAGLVYNMKGEQPGMSVFFRDGDHIYHTYSAYARGNDHLIFTYSVLDYTPLGRQENENMKIGGFLYHDKYPAKD
ncbi:hypothetical protein GP486_001739 [Trichoglossum hirsutum]|uniref:DUF899 domain-containing protein n=1 Tax=Trichoglossum hirsutum TaxID=265104 RepID=A0A9P8RSC8_9PEZI|nr:hypothetical protein GP486_001739 [Trichoglossum hirsutum]